jgi:hypothetical protein
MVDSDVTSCWIIYGSLGERLLGSDGLRAWRLEEERRGKSSSRQWIGGKSKKAIKDGGIECGGYSGGRGSC